MNECLKDYLYNNSYSFINNITKCLNKDDTLIVHNS